MESLQTLEQYGKVRKKGRPANASLESVGKKGKGQVQGKRDSKVRRGRQNVKEVSHKNGNKPFKKNLAAKRFSAKTPKGGTRMLLPKVDPAKLPVHLRNQDVIVIDDKGNAVTASKAKEIKKQINGISKFPNAAVASPLVRSPRSMKISRSPRNNNNPRKSSQFNQTTKIYHDGKRSYKEAPKSQKNYKMKGSPSVFSANGHFFTSRRIAAQTAVSSGPLTSSPSPSNTNRRHNIAANNLPFDEEMEIVNIQEGPRRIRYPPPDRSLSLPRNEYSGQVNQQQVTASKNCAIASSGSSFMSPGSRPLMTVNNPLRKRTEEMAITTNLNAASCRLLPRVPLAPQYLTGSTTALTNNNVVTSGMMAFR